MSEERQIISTFVPLPLSDRPASSKEQALPDHLQQLPGSNEWALWRCVGLRGAGFPAARILELSSPQSVLAARDLIDAEIVVQRAQEKVIEILGAALNTLWCEQKWQVEKARRNQMLNVLRVVKAGRLPTQQKMNGLDEELISALEVMRAAGECAESSRKNYQKTFQSEVAHISEKICAAAKEDRFREAVTWQNRHARNTAVDALLRMPVNVRDQERRHREELVANYLQRYTVKNDTIGFFGPVGWARLDQAEASISVEPGAELLAERTVYFETWCIDALIAKLNTEQLLRPWLAPRLLPFFYLDGNILRIPFKRPLRLPAKDAALLRACNGERTAREIVREMLRLSAATEEREVYERLAGFKSQGVIAWDLEIPLDEHPDQQLRQLLERIGDQDLRLAALRQLDDLQAAREAVIAARGADDLNQAMTTLEEVFTRVTDAAPTRAAGKTYAGRTLVYEDCRRDIEVELGRDVIEELGPPLSLLLQSARWFTWEVSNRMRRSFKDVYARIVRQTGNAVVDGLTFWMQVQPLLFGKDVPLLVEARERLQRQWAEAIALEPEQRRREYSSDELREMFASKFRAPEAGWSYAHYHSPDVMIVAESVEAIRQGNYQFVLGEVHLAMNTLSAGVHVSQHPAPEELVRALETDLPGKRLVSVPPKEWETLTARTRVALVSPKDFRLIFGADPSGVLAAKAVPIGSLVIEERNGELLVRTRDDRLSFDIIEAFGDALTNLVVDHFKLLPSEGHTPRVTIDRLTIAREAWHFSPAALSWAFLKEESERFLAARRWVQETQLPERVFVKVPVESKPFYADFASPVYVNVLARMVRRTLESEGAQGTVKLVEMMPEVEQVWLPDAAGNRYTSELRIVALDLAQ